MIHASQRNWRKRIVALAVSSLIVLLVHQLSYIGNDALTSTVQESIKVINECPEPPFEPKTDHQEKVPSNIPDVIHQIWKTADVKTYSIEASRDSWKAIFEPLNYTVKLWTEDDVVQLIRVEYPWLLSTYESYTQNIQRADVARLAVVHSQGGIYADLDVYPTSAETIRCIQTLGLEAVFPSTEGDLGMSNHFLMAAPGSHFLEWVLQEAKRRGGSRSRRILLPYLQVFWSTGPIMVTSAFRQYAWMYTTASHQVGLLDSHFGGRAFRHKAGRSWHGTDGQVLNWFADHIDAIFPWILGALVSSILWFTYRVIRRR